MDERALADNEMSQREETPWDTNVFFQKVANLVPNIIYVFNQQTQSPEYSNRSVGELMGFSRAEIQEMGAEFMPKNCHPEDLPKMAAYFENLRAMDDGEISQLEYRMKHKSGGYTWLLSVDTVFERDEDGEVVRHLGTATDITTQKQAELKLQEINRLLEDKVKERTRELAQLNAQLELRVMQRTDELAQKNAVLEQKNDELVRSNRNLTDFAHIASHDMREPLRAISNHASILLEDCSSSLETDARKRLQRLTELGHQMENQIADLLTFSRIGQKAAMIEAIDVQQIIAACELTLEVVWEIRTGG